LGTDDNQAVAKLPPPNAVADAIGGKAVATLLGEAAKVGMGKVLLLP
jgi:hypothetical protein